jgi:hypothetical protein
VPGARTVRREGRERRVAEGDCSSWPQPRRSPASPEPTSGSFAALTLP